MATLYLVEQGTSLFKEQLRFIIHVPEKEKIEVPIRDVERILIFGNINLSTPAIAGINSDLQAVESIDNIDSLRGYEGISAARYFPAFGQLITSKEFEFSQRHRQPPTDPVNALLSFGYTLLFNNVLALIISEGLSPYFGNFHYGEKKKPYLAFDLMEEFRSPIVDSLVLTVVNKSVIKSKHFEDLTAEPGIYLTESGRRIFINQFENRINEKITHPEISSQISYREAIQLQIRLYKRSLLSSTPYQSFLRSS